MVLAYLKLYISMCTPTTAGSVYSPVGPMLLVYLAYVCALCVHLCFLICLYVPILLCFPEQLSHLPYSFWRSDVTNLNEPRALTASTIAYLA